MGGINLGVNSYRVYDGKIPKNPLGTQNLRYIVYSNRTKNPDWIETRERIRGFLDTCKVPQDKDSLRTKKRLLLDEFPKANFKILNHLPELKNKQILVAVNRYGGIV